MIPPINAQLLYIGFDCQMNLDDGVLQELKSVREILLSFAIDQIENKTDNGKEEAQCSETTHR